MTVVFNSIPISFISSSNKLTVGKIQAINSNPNPKNTRVGMVERMIADHRGEKPHVRTSIWAFFPWVIYFEVKFLCVSKKILVIIMNFTRKYFYHKEGFKFIKTA